MIKVNLCPIDELESQYWYVPDLVTILLVAALGWFGVQYYLGTLQTQIDDANAETASLQDNTQKLNPDLERFKNLDKEIQELNGKLDALKTITVSKISKYKPVIVLEHLQNLKPDGVWYSELRIGVSADHNNAAAQAMPDDQKKPSDDEESSFEIRGQAFDNILTAELMTAIRSTGSQELDPADLRTQVYFSDLALDNAQLLKNGPAGFPELVKFPEFVVKGHFKERTVAAKPPGEDDDPDAKPDGDAPTVSESEGRPGGPLNF